jgi:hypothetical protein
MKCRQSHLKYFLCLIMLAIALSPVYGEDEPPFAVAAVKTHLRGSVYFLNAVFDIRLPSYIKSAVDQGFDLPLVVEIESYRQRRLWFDKKVVYIKQQYLLRYHTLLDAVSILDINAGTRRYYDSLDEAIARLSVLIDYPALDHNSLQQDKAYHARIRFGIDANELPLPLKSSSLWKNDWDLKSEWVEWELSP